MFSYLLPAALLLNIAVLSNAQCADFPTVTAAETACVGTFEAFPVNGSQLPYKCSSCGSGFICPGGNCPPVAATNEEFLNTECPVNYASATNDFSCAALQKHCEDMGQGYLMYAKIFFYLPGSRYSCSNCTGFFNVDMASSLEVPPEGTEVDAGFYSPFMLGLFGAAFLMLASGLVIEYKGKKIQDEDLSDKKLGFDICDWELKRFFGHVDSHAKPRTLCNILWQEAVLIRYIWTFCCFCCRKKEMEVVQQEVDEREEAEDRLFDTTFLIVTLFMSLGIAYLLNGLSPVQIQCELSYPSQAFVIGVADSSRLDPFLGIPPLLVPENTTEIYPRVIEKERHLMTLFEKIEAEQNTISVALTTDILTEEVILIGFLVGLEKFLRGCEEMKHWSMETLTKIHIAVRVIAVLYAMGAVLTQYFRMNVPVLDGIYMVGSNFFFVLVILTVFLPIIGFVRWTVGSCVLSCLGKSVEGATCCGSNDNQLQTQPVAYKEAQLPYAQPTYNDQFSDSGKVSL